VVASDVMAVYETVTDGASPGPAGSRQHLAVDPAAALRAARRSDDGSSPVSTLEWVTIVVVIVLIPRLVPVLQRRRLDRLHARSSRRRPPRRAAGPRAEATLEVANAGHLDAASG
jgi:hypothetical protein